MFYYENKEKLNALGSTEQLNLPHFPALELPQQKGSGTSNSSTAQPRPPPLLPSTACYMVTSIYLILKATLKEKKRPTDALLQQVGRFHFWVIVSDIIYYNNSKLLVSVMVLKVTVVLLIVVVVVVLIILSVVVVVAVLLIFSSRHFDNEWKAMITSNTMELVF